MADLVEPGGTAPHVMLWNHPLAEPNIEDASIRHALAGLSKVPGLGRVESAYRQRFRLKRWQYMTAVTDELFVAFVVGTAGFAGNGFVYAVELPGGAVHQRFSITPFSAGARLSPTSTSGSHAFARRDLGIAIDCLDGGRRFAVKIDAAPEQPKDRAGAPATKLSAELEFASGPGDDHLALCVPLPGGRWNYTHKFAAFEVSGHVAIDERRIAFERGRSYGTLDFTKMYALRHAVWRWVTLCGKSTRGAVIGLNFVDPTPDAAVSENAAWIDGRREALTEVRLEADPADAGAPWRVNAASIDLEMRAVAHVEQKLDVPLVRHRLRHIVGSFSGRVRTASGQIHDLSSIHGIAEDNDTWW